MTDLAGKKGKVTTCIRETYYLRQRYRRSVVQHCGYSFVCLVFFHDAKAILFISYLIPMLKFIDSFRRKDTKHFRENQGENRFKLLRINCI